MSRLTEHLIAFFHWVWSVSTMASVLVALIVLMQHLLKHRLKPRWHYLMWLLVIVRLILPWGPESEFSIYNWIGYPDSAHTAVQVTQDEILARAAIPETAAHYRNLFVIWLLGVCLLGIYTIRIHRKFAQRMKKDTVPMTDANVLELFHQCKKMMKIDRPIALAQSSDLATPTLFGFVKPQLIMPQTILNSLNDDELQHVFLHELAHSKRNDIIFNLIMHVLLIIHWFNPIIWYACRRMREDQEIASDALALSCLAPDKSQDYGYTLIKLLENLSQPVQVAGNVNLTGSKIQLHRRIKMIKQFKSNSYRWSFLGMATLIIISGCTLTNPKSSQTAATQVPSATPTASAAPQSTTSVDKSQETAAAGAQSTAAVDKPTASVGPRTTAAPVEPKTEPSVGPQPTASNDNPRPAAPDAVPQWSRKEPSVMPQQSRTAPSIVPQEQKRAAPSTSPQQQKRPTATAEPLPTASPSN